MTFIVGNIESRASQVGLHEQKKDTASAKREKVSLLRKGGTKSRMCGKNLTAPGRRLQQQQQHKLYLHDYNYVVTVLQKLLHKKKKQTNKS